MFTYEKSVTGKADIEKVWELYSDVTQWNLWDESVKSVQLSGPFCAGTYGVMEMTHGPNLPTVTIEGGEENQMKGMGEGIAAGIPGCLRKLFSA